jgi:uncharacterized lipoprotein YmbA
VTRVCFGIATSSLVVAILVGCGGSPDSRFYTMGGGAIPAGDRNEKATAEYTIAVGPVSLPESVDRPQIVVRVGPNQVAIMEQHRWAAPLGSEISRVIAEDLAQLLGNRLVSSYEQNTGRPDIQVLMDLQRFDSTLGESVTIDALWSIRRSLNGQTKTGRSLIQEPAGGEGYDALVAAHSRALAKVSREIAEAIRSDGTPAR